MKRSTASIIKLATLALLGFAGPAYSWHPCDKTYERLLGACKGGDIATVHKVVRGFCGSFVINRKNGAGQTALYKATDARFLDGADALLSFGADPNIPNLVGVTPLHLAAHYGYEDMLIKLLDHGAEMNAQTLGHGNVHNGFLFYGHPAESPIPGYAGRTPLHEAARMGHSGALRILLERGANCAMRERETRRTPLQEAQHWQHSDAVTELMTHQCPPFEAH